MPTYDGHCEVTGLKKSLPKMGRRFMKANEHVLDILNKTEYFFFKHQLNQSFESQNSAFKQKFILPVVL